ncbi:MAG TPA: Maf family protein [Labilithrix sp.]
MRPLLLGSASPRRREILGNVGVPFVVQAVDVDEAVRAGEAPDAYLERVVAAKLDAVRAAAAAAAIGAILVADTSVIDGGAILGKPASIDDAEQMIARLAGKTHEVHTRFAIGALEAAPVLHAETVMTRVTFRPLTAARIRAYAASGEGMDKAGAYAVQGRGSAIVSRIDGSYTNVVGLPACELVVALEALGLLA